MQVVDADDVLGAFASRFGAAHGPAAPRGTRQRIVSVGHLLPRKGFETLIRALPWIPRCAEVLIVGGPPGAELAADAEACRLRRLAAQLGVADRVCLIGAVGRADMPAVLRSADVVACTPWYESFGIVPLEAMACGIPVVATAVDGIRDTVVDEVTGRLVPPKSPRELAEAISTLLRYPRQRSAFGHAGRERACQRYSYRRRHRTDLREAGTGASQCRMAAESVRGALSRRAATRTVT